ncbi:MAG: response regulator transcription factor [Aristaeellaceae bacterium]
MHILVVDDEMNIRGMIRKYAVFEGYQVTEAADGLEAVQMCESGRFDLIVMDVMMPEMDGFTALREIRKTSDVPVIMLSARGEEYDRLRGFELGVDDYVVKPFSPRELMMRIAAILKRVTGGASDAPEIVTLGDLTVDYTARRVTIGDQVLQLSPKEYELLFYMVRNRGIALTRERLISEVWGYDFYGDDRTLDTHIKLLRKSLGPCADRISTLRGVGYRFEKD